MSTAAEVRDSFAEMLSQAAGMPVAAIDGGFRVRETGTHYIDVVRMIYSWRVCTTPKDNPLGYDRYWCFAGTDWTALLRTVLAVAEWDSGEDSDPAGWNKNGQTQEWRDPAGGW